MSIVVGLEAMNLQRQTFKSNVLITKLIYDILSSFLLYHLSMINLMVYLVGLYGQFNFYT